MPEREKPRQIKPHECLEDHDFQDWMAEENLMGRTEVLPEHLERKPKNIHAKRISDLIIDLLETNTGYVVPRERIAKEVSPNHDENDLEYARLCINNIRTVLVHPETLRTFLGIGSAFGVKRFILRQSQIPLLYHLWKNMREFVSKEELGIVLYGQESEQNTDTISEYVSTIDRVALSKTNLRLDRQSAREGQKPAYRLRPKIIQIENIPAIEPHLPPYLSTKFQDWLSSEEVALLIKSHEAAKWTELQLKKRTNVGDKERKAAEVLWQYTGYIIPLSLISQVLYGEQPVSKPTVLSVVNRLRNDLQDPRRVIYLQELGVAKDVKQLSIGRKSLVILHTLWSDLENEIPASKIKEEVKTNNMIVGEQTLYHATRELKQSLQDSSYEVLLKLSGTGETRYSLKKKVPEKKVIFDSSKK